MLENKNRLLTPDLVKLTKMNVSGRRADEPFIGTSWKAREWRVPDVRKINYPKRYPLELRGSTESEVSGAGAGIGINLDRPLQVGLGRRLAGGMGMSRNQQVSVKQVEQI